MWCFKDCHVFLDVQSWSLGIHTCLQPRPWTSPKPLIVVPSNWTRSKIPETIYFCIKGIYSTPNNFWGYSRMGSFSKEGKHDFQWFIIINPIFLPKTHHRAVEKMGGKILPNLASAVSGSKALKRTKPLPWNLEHQKDRHRKSSGKCWGKHVKSWKHMKSLKSASCCFDAFLLAQDFETRAREEQHS